MIQWRQFESKKISRNEVYEILRINNFLEFFMIFQEFLELKKSQKGFICVGTAWSGCGTAHTHGGTMGVDTDLCG